MAKVGKPTQEFIPIKEIRDGIAVLKDGGMRAILMASSVNISLKSHDEQEAVISQFRNFLNSIEFSVQIVTQSRRLDIKPYLKTLEERLEVQTEDLLRTQTAEYIGFIKWFTDTSNIMTKNFYVVIPYSYAPLAEQNIGSTITKFLPFLAPKKPAGAATMAEFEESRTQLEQRIGIVQSGLSSVGIRSVQLGNQEMVEVYYRIFNPGEQERRIPDGTMEREIRDGMQEEKGRVERETERNMVGHQATPSATPMTRRVPLTTTPTPNATPSATKPV